MQVCTSANNGAIALTVPSAGRFDLLFDGSTLSCSQSASFPAAPPALTFASVDAIAQTVNILGATASNVSLTNSNGMYQNAPNVLDVVQQDSNSPIPVKLNFNYTVNQAGCNGSNCLVQLQYGLNTDSASQSCAYSGIPAVTGTSGTASVSVNVPNAPGRYYVALDKSLQFGCVNTWNSGQPSASHYIGVVDVLPPAPQ